MNTTDAWKFDLNDVYIGTTAGVITVALQINGTPFDFSTCTEIQFITKYREEDPNNLENLTLTNGDVELTNNNLLTIKKRLISKDVYTRNSKVRYYILYSVAGGDLEVYNYGTFNVMFP